MSRIPWIARGRKAHRLRSHRRAELRHVGTADSDEPGRTEHLGQEGRDRPGQLTQRPDAKRCGLPGDHAANVLEQDRHTAERAVGQIAGGFLSGQVESRPDHGVQLRIKLLDPGDGGVHELERACLAAANQIGLRGRVQPGDICHQANLCGKIRTGKPCWFASGSPGHPFPGQPLVARVALSAMTRSAAASKSAWFSRWLTKSNASLVVAVLPWRKFRELASIRSMPARAARETLSSVEPTDASAPASSASVIVTPPKPSLPRSSPRMIFDDSPAGFTGSRA